MKDRHHWIPLSLMGPDLPQNIVLIDRGTHQHIHQVCNYDMRTYSEMMRAFRRKHNHHLSHWNEALVDDILRIQGGYLHRYTGLAPGPQKLHMRVMNDLVQMYEPNHQTQHNWGKLWYEYCEAFKAYHLS